MARAQATDPLHAFRFHVRADSVAGIGDDPLQPGGKASPAVGVTAEAGFQAVGSPEYTVETAEYREGLQTYAQKYPGIPTVNDITMSRGAAPRDTSFYTWIKAAIEGREYRSDVTVFHALRNGRSFPFDPVNDFAKNACKRYILRDAYPSRVKISGDLDSSTSDVSLAEVDVVFEKFDVEVPAAP